MQRILELIKKYYQSPIHKSRQLIYDTSENFSIYDGFSYPDEFYSIFKETYNLIEQGFNHTEWWVTEKITTEKLINKDSRYLINYLYCLHRGEKFCDGIIASAFNRGDIDIAFLTITKNEIYNKFYWNNLSPLELGKFSEYLAKIELLKFGFQVYQSEVDDRGIDFIAKNGNALMEIQVKSARLEKTNYIFFTKTNLFYLRESLFICLLLFSNDLLPSIYLIPSQDLNKNNGLFIFRDYTEIQKSKPEWGIQLSKKNLSKLLPYKIELTLTKSIISNIINNG